MNNSGFTTNGKTILITGANGNLGTAVTAHFLAKNYKVIATVSCEEGKKDFPLNDNLRVEAVNLTVEAEAESFVRAVLEHHKQLHGALLLVGGFAAGNIG